MGKFKGHFIGVPAPIVQRSDLTATAKLFYGKLVSDRPGFRPTLEQISTSIGCSRRTTFRAASELEAKGLIRRTITRRRGAVNTYEVRDDDGTS